MIYRGLGLLLRQMVINWCSFCKLFHFLPFLCKDIYHITNACWLFPKSVVFLCYLSMCTLLEPGSTNQAQKSSMRDLLSQQCVRASHWKAWLHHFLFSSGSRALEHIRTHSSPHIHSHTKRLAHLSTSRLCVCLCVCRASVCAGRTICGVDHSQMSLAPPPARSPYINTLPCEGII